MSAVLHTLKELTNKTDSNHETESLKFCSNFPSVFHLFTIIVTMKPFNALLTICNYNVSFNNEEKGLHDFSIQNIERYPHPTFYLL